MFLMGDTNLRCGEVLIHEQGVWTAELEPIEPTTLATGQRVTLTLGDLTMSGTILRGGMFTPGNGFFVIGGAAGWRKPVNRKPYHDTKGVKLRDLARDLATETGEQVTVDSSLTSKLVGDHWTRPECSGAAALTDLGQPWRVMPSGITTVGPIATVETSALVSVSKFYPTRNCAILEFPDDELSAVVPGTSLEVGEVAMVVRTARISLADGGKVVAEVLGV